MSGLPQNWAKCTGEALGVEAPHLLLRATSASEVGVLPWASGPGMGGSARAAEGSVGAQGPTGSQAAESGGPSA